MSPDADRASAPDSPDPQPPPACKLRLRFRKDGDLRLISHHDLMHCFERAFRRAGVPLRVTQGFHPQPRMVFGLSLALGIIGGDEVLEVELAQPLPPEEARERLARACPPGLTLLDARTIDPKARAQVFRVAYRLPLPADPPADLAQRVADLLAATDCPVQRSRPQPRQVNVRPFLAEVRIVGGFLEMDMWVGPSGSARPEEVLRLLGVEHWLDRGAVLERYRMFVADEAAADATVAPQITQPGRPEAGGKAASSERPHPLLPGPLAFDS